MLFKLGFLLLWLKKRLLWLFCHSKLKPPKINQTKKLSKCDVIIIIEQLIRNKEKKRKTERKSKKKVGKRLEKVEKNLEKYLFLNLGKLKKSFVKTEG